MRVETDAATLDRVLAEADAAFHRPPATPRERADWLRASASALEAAGDELVELAGRETHLTTERLRGELVRTVFQLHLTATAVAEGAWLEASIDHADPEWPMGARPDVRRLLQPLGPVLVFPAGNFPLAFGVLGGDTATAIGAGCPVVVKAHPGYPALSRRVAEVGRAALHQAGAPDGMLALVEGTSAGTAAIVDPRIAAAAFTGSLAGGRALFDLAVSRPDPIPFYGELGSVNPAFVLPSAAAGDPNELWEGFLGSVSLGVGQFCTKPGVLFVPAGRAIPEQVAALVPGRPPAPMLSERIFDGFAGRIGEMRDRWTVLSEGSLAAGAASITVFGTRTADVEDVTVLAEEAFGPAAVVVEYDRIDEIVALAAAFPGQLTATVHGDGSDPGTAELLDVLAERAGRIVWNAWPTGVSVTWAMHHGGPWPATTASIHTSVGPTAIRRFVRPVALQDVPAHLLPAAVQDQNPWQIPRRVDGELEVPGREG